MPTGSVKAPKNKGKLLKQEEADGSASIEIVTPATRSGTRATRSTTWLHVRISRSFYLFASSIKATAWTSTDKAGKKRKRVAWIELVLKHNMGPTQTAGKNKVSSVSAAYWAYGTETKIAKGTASATTSVHGRPLKVSIP